MLNKDIELQNALNQGHAAAWDLEWKKAEEFYKTAYKISPEDTIIINNVALALFNQEKYEESLKFYLESIKLHDESPAPYQKSAKIFEHLNKLDLAANQYMITAEIFLKQKDLKKAIEHWKNVVRLNTQHINAHKRLAVVYQKTNNMKNALNEYLHLVAIYQHEGNLEQARAFLKHASTLDSKDPDYLKVKQALDNNERLPLPQSISYPERIDTNVLDESTTTKILSSNPIDEAKMLAAEELAVVLFELCDPEEIETERKEKDLYTAILISPGLDREKVIFHLSQAVNAMTNDVTTEVLEQLEEAERLGLSSPPSSFIIGYYHNQRGNTTQVENNLRKAVQDKKYELASRLIIANNAFKNGDYKRSVEEYLLALRKVDSETVDRESSNELYQSYDPLIESMKKSKDVQVQKTLSQNIFQLLNTQDYRKAIKDLRDQFIGDYQEEVLPIAQFLTEESNSELIEVIAKINELINVGYYHSALEDVYLALSKASSYLPLHTLIADILMQLGQQTESAEKYEIIARTYLARGESRRARTMFEKVVSLSPMNIDSRLKLVSLLESSGEYRDALAEYMRISDIYYRLAQLDDARLVCEKAYHLGRQSGVEDEWIIKILTKTADLDLQRLDWPNAIKIYEMIYMMQPGNENATSQLIELNCGISNTDAAISVMNDFINQQFKIKNGNRAMAFLENFSRMHPEFLFINQRLGEIYSQAGLNKKAINQWQTAAEVAKELDNKTEARSFYQMIISLEPNNIDEYRQKMLEI